MTLEELIQFYKDHAHTGTDSQQINYNNLQNLPTIPTVPSFPLSIANGGTASATASGALTNLGGVFNGSSTSGQFSSNTFDDGNSGTAKTINWALGNRHKLTLTGDATLTFSNPISGATYTLELVQDGTGSRVPVFPAIKWVGGVGPLLSTAINSIDVISLYYNGSYYLGTYSLAFA